VICKTKLSDISLARRFPQPGNHQHCVHTTEAAVPPNGSSYRSVGKKPLPLVAHFLVKKSKVVVRLQCSAAEPQP
jgi:hypothetical protein